MQNKEFGGLPDYLKNTILGSLNNTGGCLIIDRQGKKEGKFSTCSRCSEKILLDTKKGTLLIQFIPILCDRCRIEKP